jgi:ketosteroid isomerase-like protein
MTAMEPTPLELCSLAYARYSEGEFDALLELFDPQVEVFVAPPNFESGTYHGHAEYRALLERWAVPWDEMRITPKRLTGARDWVLAVVEYRGCGKGSGVEITQPSWELSLWPHGRCTRYEVYWDQQQGERAFARCAEDTPTRSRR